MTNPRPPGIPPATWDDAVTVDDIALAGTDAGGKDLRFGDYYRQPCLDYLLTRMRLTADVAEDLVQDFFCDLEDRLVKGKQAGTVWKQALRRAYRADGDNFRAYLGRSLRNYAIDWLRTHHSVVEAPAGREQTVDLDHEVAQAKPAWTRQLERFKTWILAQEPALERPVQVLLARLRDDEDLTAIATRLDLSERSARNDQTAAATRLVVWTMTITRSLTTAPRLTRLIQQGMVSLPDWLRSMGREKRARILLFLAALARIEANDGAAKPWREACRAH